jgi:integral membrane sensor domain MASE1
MRLNTLRIMVVWVFSTIHLKSKDTQGICAESLLFLLILSYFLLFCVWHHICFLMIPVLCHATRHSKGYGHLRFCKHTSSGTRGMYAKSILSLLILSYFLLICVPHHISFLMIPVLCHATRYSRNYACLIFFNCTSSGVACASMLC